MFTIVISKKDPASMNIYESLKKIDPTMNFLVSEEDIINVDVSSKLAETEYFIFASRHKSASKIKTLSIHLIGNWNKAEYGGEERRLSGASSHLLKKFFIELNIQRDVASLQYKCTLEATHHGPYVSKPSLFIEIGSSEEEWEDKAAGDVIAKTIFTAIHKFSKPAEGEENWQTALVFGGGHYCKAFNKLLLEGEYAFSHICSKYNLPFINEEMIARAIDATKERIDLVLLDWKGLSGEKKRLTEILDEIGLFYEKV